MPAVGRYAEVLRAPHVTPLLLASMLAQLPYGVYALAAILYLAQARGSLESDEAVSRLNEAMQAIPRRVGIEELTPLAGANGQRAGSRSRIALTRHASAL